MVLNASHPATEDFRRQWESDSDYIVAHTSGSTGTPKEIHLPKGDMLTSARATIRRFGLTHSDTLLLPLSPEYIAGKMMAVRAFEAGCRLIVEQPSNHPWIADYGPVTLMAVVPSQVPSLLENPRAATSLKYLIVGGAPLLPDLEEQLAKMPWQSYATYGMTETCSHVALRPMGQPLYEAMPGIEFALDERGCLVIEAPAYSFRRLITNDVVELHSPATFRWLGRADNVINSGGVKLHPEELERLLAPAISQAFYLDGVPDPKWGTALRLTVEHPAPPAGYADELTSLCRTILPHQSVPRVVRILPSIPRTSSGKIIRR